MATVTKEVCDRCGEERWQNGNAGNLKIRKTLTSGLHATLIKFFNGNYSGYDYADYDYYLCSNCAKDFKDWINNEQK